MQTIVELPAKKENKREYPYLAVTRQYEGELTDKDLKAIHSEVVFVVVNSQEVTQLGGWVSIYIEEDMTALPTGFTITFKQD